MVLKPDSGDCPELLVVGAAFFEAFMPGCAAPGPGIEKYVDEIPLGLGGALNSATVAAALGIRTGFMHPATSWLVDGAISECCRRTGLAEYTWGDGGAPFVTLVWTDRGDRAFVSSADWGLLGGCPPFPGARHVHIGGLAEFELLRDQAAHARHAGAKISTCAGWDPPSLSRVAAETGCPLDVLFMNRAEATAICGGVDQALRVLPGRAAVEVVVTDGAAGALSSFGTGIIRCAAPKVDVLDPTGAGDAFAAAWLSAMLQARRGGTSFDRQDALVRACAVASRVVGMRGGVVIDPDQVTSR